MDMPPQQDDKHANDNSYHQIRLNFGVKLGTSRTPVAMQQETHDKKS
jgi:hypothetical protein